jgi:hypothetical protein
MKMVKSLLLGSAAGIVAVAGAQAADLPVKAKPVEYVKVCSLYGAGFFYIPGTDTCIKLGGAVRVQAEFNTGAGGVPVGFGSNTEAGQGNFQRSLTNDTNFRTRIYFSVDARQQTEYGTLRSYVRFGVQQTTPADTIGGSVYWDRAFIQFAGFTVGRTVSFYDANTFADVAYNNPRTTFDSGANGVTVWAYTAQFGNGFSATLAAEDPDGRFKGVLNAAPTGSGSLISALALGTQTVTAGNGLAGNAGGNGFLYPDIVGNLRVDQAWGSAQIMAAMHDASGAYYNNASVSTGHPGNAYGWAAGAGFLINLPSFGATGNANSQPNVDQLKANFSYTKGATGYATNGNGASLLVNGNKSVAAAWQFDGVYSTGSNVELTTAWSAYGAFQHIWSPQWRTSLYGGYLKVEYDGAASQQICQSTTGPGNVLPASVAAAGLINGKCMDYSQWQIGTRTQWNPVSQLDVGVDVLYSKLNSALTGGFTGGGPVLTSTSALTGRPFNLSYADQDVWSVMFRVQRNFWP